MIRRGVAAGIQKLVRVEIVGHLVNRADCARLRLERPVRIAKIRVLEIHREQA
jgi:hypothetical protein